MYIDKDGGAQCVADNEDNEREILLYPGTKSKSGDMEIDKQPVRWRHKT